jgi:multiple sugar transport system ATP-binding protein
MKDRNLSPAKRSAALAKLMLGTQNFVGRFLSAMDQAAQSTAHQFKASIYASRSMKDAGYSKADIDAKVGRAAEILGLSQLLGRFPRQLSGGQRQRVAMGRAIVRDPQVFLYDEPLSNLDAKLRVAMRTELKELHQRLKTTSIYVTHDQIEAMTMGDQIVVMRDGRIEQAGSPLHLYDQPVNLFVAGFIGSPAMNLLPGTVRIDQGVRQIELADGTCIPAPSAVRLEGGQSVIFGTRPENLSLEDQDAIAVQVVTVEPTGADTFVVCRHRGSEISAVFRERHSFTPGSTIHLRPDTSRCHLFDPESGMRLPAD